VVVNGEVVSTPGISVDPAVDLVLVDGRPLPFAEPREYVLLNKPRGYVTTRSDPGGRPVVTDLVRGTRARLFPVGRLDFDVEGLLLLTNDGDLTHRLLHPRYAIPRVYEAMVRGVVRGADLARWRAGVRLDDGLAVPGAVEVAGRDADRTRLRLTFAEGRKHEVKRYCEALGHPVVRLRRIAFGPLTLGDLGPGQARPLTKREVARLRSASGTPRGGGKDAAT